MKRYLSLLCLLLMPLLLEGCRGRCVRQAIDITPGNTSCGKMDWRYGAADIRIQTGKITRQLMDRWFA